MFAIEVLGRKDTAEVAGLLRRGLDGDAAYRYVFPDSVSRERWLGRVFYWASIAQIGRSDVTGIRERHSGALIAVASWQPPPATSPWLAWHLAWQFIAGLPLLPMALEYATYARLVTLSRGLQSLAPRGEPLLSLHGLVVRHDFRRRGLATSLIRWGQEGASIADCRIFLTCSASLVPYYERHGFQEISRIQLEGAAESQHGMIWEPNGLATSV